jgi:hypothetical protein
MFLAASIETSIASERKQGLIWRFDACISNIERSQPFGPHLDKIAPRHESDSSSRMNVGQGRPPQR